MTTLKFDNVTVENFSLTIDADFGKENLSEEQSDTGHVTAKFSIEGQDFEYSEWYSVEET